MVKKLLALGTAFALFVSLLISTPQFAKAAPTNTNFGFATGYTILEMNNTELDSYLNQIAATGAAYLRFDFDWGVIQAGGSTSYDFTNTDRVVDAAIAKGFKILALPTGTTSWSGSPVPTKASYYQNFLYKIGLHYIPKGVTEWELWNEPNIQGLSPAAYTQKILIPGATGIRQAASELGKTVKVISGGLAPAATDGTDYSPVDYVTGIYANGGKNYFDALALHPYTWPADPSVPSAYNTLLNSQDLYNVMVTNGDSAKKMWATEMGFPTNSTSYRGITEAKQAQYIVDAYNIWKGFSYSDGPFMMYSFQDNGTDVTNPEDFFGIIRYNGTAKAAYSAVVNMIANNPPGSGSTTYYKIQNRWKPNEYLYDGGTRVKYGNGTTDAYLWSLETVGSKKRIKNKATGEYINIKNGATHVESTAIASTDTTSQWTIGSSSGSSSAQYMKSASSNNYINVEDQLGYATCDISGAPSDTDWYSAQWFFIQQ